MPPGLSLWLCFEKNRGSGSCLCSRPRGYDGDISALFENGIFNVRHLFKTKRHAGGLQNIVFRDFSLLHALGKRPAFVDNHQRQPFRYLPDEREILLEERENQIGTYQRDDKDKRTGEGVVSSNKSLLGDLAD